MKFTNTITSLHLHLMRRCGIVLASQLLGLLANRLHVQLLGHLASRLALDVTFHLQLLFLTVPVPIVPRTRSELTLLVAVPLLVVESVTVRQVMTALPQL